MQCLCTLCMRTSHHRCCRRHLARAPGTLPERCRIVRRLRRARCPRTPRQPPRRQPRGRDPWGRRGRPSTTVSLSTGARGRSDRARNPTRRHDPTANALGRGSNRATKVPCLLRNPLSLRRDSAKTNELFVISHPDLKDFRGHLLCLPLHRRLVHRGPIGTSWKFLPLGWAILGLY